MNEFEYLKKMYQSLSEFEHLLAEKERNNPNIASFIYESAVCAIECAIKNYLEMRRSVK